MLAAKDRCLNPDENPAANYACDASEAGVLGLFREKNWRLPREPQSLDKIVSVALCVMLFNEEFELWPILLWTISV